MKPYTKYKTGSWDEVGKHNFCVPEAGIEALGKVFLQEKAELTSAEISMNVLPPGTTVPFSHKHDKNEEIYIGMGGRGQFVVNGDPVILEEGDVLRVSAATERTWRALGDEKFSFLCIQAREGSIEASTINDGALVNPEFNWDAIEKA